MMPKCLEDGVRHQCQEVGEVDIEILSDLTGGKQTSLDITG